MSNILSQFSSLLPVRSLMGAAITATTISQVAKIQNFDVANITARMNFVAWGTLGATTYWSIKTLTNVPSVMRLIRSMPGYSTVFVFTQTRFSNLMLSVVGCGLIAGGVWGTNKLMESRFEKALPLTPPGVEGTAPNPDAPKANWDSPFPKCLEQGMVLTQLICSLALIKLSNSSRFFAGLATLQAIGYLALANWKWIAVKMNTGSIAFADAEDPTITTTVSLPIYPAASTTSIIADHNGIMVYNFEGLDIDATGRLKANSVLAFLPEGTSEALVQQAQNLIKNFENPSNANEAIGALEGMAQGTVRCIQLAEGTLITKRSGVQIQEKEEIGNIEGSCPVCRTPTSEEQLYRICKMHNLCLDCLQGIFASKKASLTANFREEGFVPNPTIGSQWTDCTVQVLDEALPKCATCRDLSPLLTVAVDIKNYPYRSLGVIGTENFSAEVDIVKNVEKPVQISSPITGILIAPEDTGLQDLAVNILAVIPIGTSPQNQSQIQGLVNTVNQALLVYINHQTEGNFEQYKQQLANLNARLDSPAQIIQLDKANTVAKGIEPNAVLKKGQVIATQTQDVLHVLEALYPWSNWARWLFWKAMWFMTLPIRR